MLLIEICDMYDYDSIGHGIAEVVMQPLSESASHASIGLDSETAFETSKLFFRTSGLCFARGATTIWSKHICKFCA